MTQRIILVEDDDTLRVATKQMLELADHEVDGFSGAEDALSALDVDFNGIIVSDIRMPRMDGLELLARTQMLDPEIPVILVTGHGDVPMAVKALRDGAADFLVKPFAADHLKAAVRRSLAHRALVIENRRLRQLATAADQDDALLGQSAPIQQMRLAIGHLASADVDILVEGEAGTGKELVAIMLHRLSSRRARAFVAVSCAALEDETAELELFGHAADSVPHTRLARDGQIALSNGGTLLLDDVDALSSRVQAKLLRVIEDREVHPVGAERPRALDLHLIMTSKIDLGRAVEAGTFRADLFYRLSAARLRIPAVRERGDDVLALFAVFAEEAKQQFGIVDWAPDLALIDHLRSHDWPGNVRELRSFAYETVLDASKGSRPYPAVTGDLPSRVATFEATTIEAALRNHRGNVPSVLATLGVPRKTLYDKMARYGLVPSRFRRSDDG